MRKIDYNSQRNNKTFGKFPGSKQCFSTVSWMFISYYNKNYDGKNDSQLAKYFDDVEDSIGKKGIGEKIKAKFSWITGNSSYWFLVQKAGIEKCLPNKKIEFDDKFPIKNLCDIVKKGPVIISTKGLGGLRGGHIILLVDNWELSYISTKSFYVHDPFGNANSNYLITNGENVIYTYNFLKKHVNKGDGKCWVLYAKK